MSQPDVSSIGATKQPILVYDGECGFCSRSIQFILRREREHQLLFVTRQSELGIHLRRQYGLETMESMLWIEDGKVLAESSAVLRIAGYVGGWFRVAAIGYVFPPNLRNWAYRLFARNRHRFARNSEQCLVPTPEQRKRFVT
ncbi:MAG: putative thiol-disulfide oxidoreductase [Candidatus Angelobacter sp.]|nr:putative thiol-disulfide oxidoreductase [Candidatus Angelobacter sp.]